MSKKEKSLDELLELAQRDLSEEKAQKILKGRYTYTKLIRMFFDHYRIVPRKGYDKDYYTLTGYTLYYFFIRYLKNNKHLMKRKKIIGVNKFLARLRRLNVHRTKDKNYGGHFKIKSDNLNVLRGETIRAHKYVERLKRLEKVARNAKKIQEYNLRLQENNTATSEARVHGCGLSASTDPTTKGDVS